MHRILKQMENIGLVAMTGLAIVILATVLITFGLSSVPGLFQLYAGTLAVGWLTLFALANMEIDKKRSAPAKQLPGHTRVIINITQQAKKVKEIQKK